MQRRLGHELMDDPGVPREPLARALGFIRWINARMGGTRALLAHLRRWSVAHRWPRVGEGAVTLLDVGTGSADIPVAARAWGLAEGYDLRITGIDLHDTTLDLARQFVDRQRAAVRAGIELRKADALALDEAVPRGSFDYAHAGLFLHHLPEDAIVRVLRSMDRAAARGVVWNDLHRSRVGYAVAWVMTLPCDRMVRHDARASVLAGFDRLEALGHAATAGGAWAAAQYRLDYLAHRFTVAASKA